MENTPPEDREICRSRDFAPRGLRDCLRAISRSEGGTFLMHPNSRLWIDILFFREGEIECNMQRQLESICQSF